MTEPLCTGAGTEPFGPVLTCAAAKPFGSAQATAMQQGKINAIQSIRGMVS
jgi:hypothetical protein